MTEKQVKLKALIIDITPGDITLCGLLGEFNVTTDNANTISNGMAKLSEGSYDLAFIDAVFELDAIEACRRAASAGIITYITTAGAQEWLRDKARELEGVVFIDKPYDLNHLAEVVEHAKNGEHYQS